MRKKQGVAVEHPREINALVDQSREPHDLTIIMKALPRSQDTREQQRRVYRRDFAIPSSLACSRVEPVIKPPALFVRSLGKKMKSTADSFARVILVDPSSLVSYRKR